jgi:hypothetical protein
MFTAKSLRNWELTGGNAPFIVHPPPQRCLLTHNRILCGIVASSGYVRAAGLTQHGNDSSHQKTKKLTYERLLLGDEGEYL